MTVRKTISPAPVPRLPRLSRLAAALALAASLAACAVGPAYERPDIATPVNWKEAAPAAGWTAAAPADAHPRGPWWTLFGDATLNELAERVQVSNQNIAAAAATYAQAQAAVREQRSALFPTLGISGSARRSGTRETGSASGSAAVALEGDWAPDLWGRVREATNSAQAQAQASEADLAAARLSIQGALASNYFSLREADVEMQVVDASIAGYERSLTIARNRYEAGIAPQSDVTQAETQLANTRADRASLVRTRAVLEHAIAVLAGAAPADFSLAPARWTPTVPDIPLAVPSELLQRRPDIAASERAVASANAQIGIARSAYYPTLSLSASLGRTAGSVSNLFNASDTLWSLGLSVAQVVFDAGAIGARVDQAQAGRDAAVARYRQTVLTAFQGVEDQLSAVAALRQQEDLRRAASVAADKTEQQVQNRYFAGQVSYVEVVLAQISALNARRNLLQVQVARQLAAVGLIQAMGGGWQAAEMAEMTDKASQPASR